jgi:predicted metal-dependent peptidase
MTMNAETAAENAALIKRARSHLMSIAWTYTALARAAAGMTLHVANSVQTAAVDKRGRIYLAPKFMAGLTAEEFCFVLAHEMLHVLFEHFGRMGNREPRRWNRATDRAINQSLRLMGMTAPACALFPLPGTPVNASAEELYELEPIEPPAGSCGGDGEPLPTGGCGVSDPDTGDGEDDGTGSGADADTERAADQHAAAIWRQAAIEVATAAKSAGDASLGALIKLLEIPPARVRWGDLLRRALSGAIAGAGRDDVSWSRKSRRGAVLNCVLPGGVTTKAAIAVVIDASGSVSDASLAQAIAETGAAVNASACPAYLVVHDVAVQWEGWIRPGANAQRLASSCLKGRGGTAFSPAYDAVQAVKRAGRFGTLVHLTDGMPCEAWPDKPSNCRKAIVGLIGHSVKDHVPDYARIVMVEAIGG